MRIKKKWAAVLTVCCVLLTACAHAPSDQYQDILADTDALMRFTICFDDVRKGRDTSYTSAELRALSRDLEEGYKVDDPNAQEATRLFQQAAQQLRQYLIGKKADSTLYEQAEACYAAGITAMHEIPDAPGG